MGRKSNGGVYKRGNVYWIHFQVDGARKFESARTGDKREAMALLAQRRREVRTGVIEAVRELTVAEYAERWVAQRREAGVRNIHDGDRRLGTSGATP